MKEAVHPPDAKHPLGYGKGGVLLVVVAILLSIGIKGLITGEAAENAIYRVEADLRKAFPAVQWCFFEPDNKN